MFEILRQRYVQLLLLLAEHDESIDSQLLTTNLKKNLQKKLRTNVELKHQETKRKTE